MTARSPRWRVELPRHWEPYRAPDVAVVARPPRWSGSVVPHVIVGRDPLPASVALDDVAARAVEAACVAGRDAELLGEARAVSGSLERCVRVVTFAPDRPAVDVVQVLAFVASRERTVSPDRDVVQFVGTCALGELARYAPSFASVVESIALLS